MYTTKQSSYNSYCMRIYTVKGSTYSNSLPIATLNTKLTECPYQANIHWFKTCTYQCEHAAGTDTSIATTELEDVVISTTTTTKSTTTDVIRVSSQPTAAGKILSNYYEYSSWNSIEKMASTCEINYFSSLLPPASCPPHIPSLPLNMVILTPLTNTVPPGTTLTIGCVDGYYTDQMGTMTCGTNGQWTGTPTQCTGMNVIIMIWVDGYQCKHKIALSSQFCNSTFYSLTV